MKFKLMFLLLGSALFLGVQSVVVHSEEGATEVEHAAPVKKKSTKKKKRLIKRKENTPKAAVPMQEKTTASLDNASTQSTTKMKPSVQNWLKKMKSRVAKTQAKHNQLIAVAAVRGSETPDSPPLYWKGQKSEGVVQAPELNEFNTALDQALKGDSADAKTKLESFITAHPDSPLVADAKQTIEIMNEGTEEK